MLLFEAFTSWLEPARDKGGWLRRLELKLPGAGDGASDEPRGAKDEEEFDDSARVVLPNGCSPSLSVVIFWPLLYCGGA